MVTSSIEDVRNHLKKIRDKAGYTVPNGSTDEMTTVVTTISRTRGDPPRQLLPERPVR